MHAGGKAFLVFVNLGPVICLHARPVQVLHEGQIDKLLFFFTFASPPRRGGCVKAVRGVVVKCSYTTHIKSFGDKHTPPG
jgi:hypothetical protein